MIGKRNITWFLKLDKFYIIPSRNCNRRLPFYHHLLDRTDFSHGQYYICVDCYKWLCRVVTILDKLYLIICKMRAFIVNIKHDTKIIYILYYYLLLCNTNFIIARFTQNLQLSYFVSTLYLIYYDLETSNNLNLFSIVLGN